LYPADWSYVKSRRIPTTSRRLMVALGSVIGLLAVAHPIFPESAEVPGWTLKWIHENPSEIAKFKVFFGPAPDKPDPAEGVDVGLPLQDGAYIWPVVVPEGGVVWAAVKAIDQQGVASKFSRWKRYPPLVPLTPPDKAFLVE
jgi:hypothetical protein